MYWSKMILIYLSLVCVVVAQAESEVVVMQPRTVFVPTGFDDNDNAQVVFEGEVPNSCYKIGATKVSINQQNKKILITHQVIKQSGEGVQCLQLTVPYQQAVDLGRIAVGEYSIYFAKADGSDVFFETFSIAQSKSPNIDNHNYAPITDISLTYNQEKQSVLTLFGTFTRSCAWIDKVEVIRNKANILEILPVIDFVPNPNCVNITNHFRHEVLLPSGLQGKVLIHVRSLHGKAFNLVGSF